MTNKLPAYLLAAALAVAVCGQAATSAANASAPAQSEASIAKSGAYKPDPHHHYIAFSYLHQGFSHPQLRWGAWDATLNWNAEHPEASSVTATIDANSIDSGFEDFNGHLKSDRFFDAATYPEITFNSTKIEKTGANTGKMTGDLTIKGATKPVTLDVTFNKAAYDERQGVYKIGFSAHGVVKRSDFGVDMAVPMVSDDVDVTIESEFVMSAKK